MGLFKRAGLAGRLDSPQVPLPVRPWRGSRAWTALRRDFSKGVDELDGWTHPKYPYLRHARLRSSTTPLILHKGREARCVPWSHGMHLTTMGKLVCSHGCSKATLHDKRRQLRGNGDLKNRCACKPWSFPKRSALDGVQLGRYQGLRCRDNR